MNRDHTRLMCDVGELSGLFSDATSLQTFLQRTVEMVVDHMQSDVCSIYLYHEDSGELVLTATQGLDPRAVGRVRLRLGEGLTGLAVEARRPICERHASQRPEYKYFPQIGEEPYESFLAVPILRGETRIGAMVIQKAERDFFSEEDVRAFQVITSQLATTLETAKLLMRLQADVRPQPCAFDAQRLKLVKARVAVEGCVRAPAMVFAAHPTIERLYEQLPAGPFTLADFERAVQQTEEQLRGMQQQIEERLSDVASLIFTAQLLMLKDEEFIGAIRAAIAAGASAEQAVLNTVNQFVRMFDALASDYLKEKRHDVIDIGMRLLENLSGLDKTVYHYQDRIVIAQQLYPSDILQLSSLQVKGIILLSGGVTSHIAILARSLGIPLVITDECGLRAVPLGTEILLDADQGNIYVEPSAEVIATFEQKEFAIQERGRLPEAVAAETWTADRERIRLLANINLLSDVGVARSFSAEGVGLYRTEFPFIVRSSFPTEEEQYVIYRKLVAAMPGQEVTFRTLDIGGDKVLSYYNYGREENPFLGMRSIRFSLRHKEIFHQQLRAILRAGAGADLKIMFPMISSVEEFLDAQSAVAHCAEELQRAGVAHQANPRVGLMVELPAVLEIIDDLAALADFLSIGTNDFIQYMLAVDRTNEKVSDLYLPQHPAILRALARIAAAGQAHGKEVSVCGQMAQEERFLPFFLGIGVRVFSLDPHYIYRVQKAIGGMDMSAARQGAAALLRCTRLEEVNALLL